MGKVIDKGSKPPDDPIFSEPWSVSAVFRPTPAEQETPEEKVPPRWGWRDLPVDPRQDHFDLRYGTTQSNRQDWLLVALVGPPRDGEFAVEWLVDPNAPAHAEAAESVREELDFYLVELREPDPWAYARYHCSTTSNLYSRVHWSFRTETADPTRQRTSTRS
jgi:hypothetical protein